LVQSDLKDLKDLKAIPDLKVPAVLIVRFLVQLDQLDLKGLEDMVTII
jgi:hypothetical protein